MNTRPEDRPLHADVRNLSSTLGHVIRDLEGEDAFVAVETLRGACKARRAGEADALSTEDLLDQIASWPLQTSSVVARAFTLFFLLINTAEQVHRVRRRRSYPADPAQPGSPRWALGTLANEGRSAEEVATLLKTLRIQPVLTAHPTESTRRTVLNLQHRVGQILLDGGDEMMRLLRTEVELLWLTTEVRRDRPSVLDEVSTALWYLEDRLIDAASTTTRSIERAFEDLFGQPLKLQRPIVLGSWIGGDRDGNPFVTPEITLAATRRAAHRVLGHYLERVEELIVRLSLSSQIRPAPTALRSSLENDRQDLPEIYETNQRRDTDEPVRLKLSFIAERLTRTRQRIADRDAGQVRPRPHSYGSAEALLEDLKLVRNALAEAGAMTALGMLLDPLVGQVEAYGFFGYALDVREDSGVHTATVDHITDRLGLPRLDMESVTRELLGRRPLIGPHIGLEAAAAKAVGVFETIFEVQDELGHSAIDTYIISMCTSAEDVLRVLLLAKETGLVELSTSEPRSRLDIVPLFETRDDLVNAPAIMRALFENPAYQRQLAARGHRQEVMIGYSDSAKDAGMLAAAWALYTGQERIAEVCREYGVSLTLFHGRGGTVGRGGGSPVFRALSALPAGTVNGRIKITEQGELISQKFGLAPLAARSLEVMVTGTLMASVRDWRSTVVAEEEASFRACMDELASLALPVFRGLVHEDDVLFALFQSATPVRELAHVHYGSRPAYRERGSGKMTGIRAIPWVFGWTQIRSMLPAWLGTGTALATVGNRPGGLELLRRMATHWPFFDDLLGKLEMVLSKSDPEIARAYVNRLSPGHLPLLETLEDERRRAEQMVLRIRDRETLLANNPVLEASIALRNPYVDPLSLLQIVLLEKRRAGEDEPALLQVLGTTLNGVAQGMRNTG